MNSIKSVDSILEKIKCSGAKRVRKTWRHPAVRRGIRLQFRLSLNHFPWGRPGGPLLLVLDARRARPRKTLSADTDAISQSLVSFLDQIKIFLVWIDYECARLLSSWIIDELPPILRSDDPRGNGRNGERL